MVAILVAEIEYHKAIILDIVIRWLSPAVSVRDAILRRRSMSCSAAAVIDTLIWPQAFCPTCL